MNPVYQSSQLRGTLSLHLFPPQAPLALSAASALARLFHDSSSNDSSPNDSGRLGRASVWDVAAVMKAAAKAHRMALPPFQHLAAPANGAGAGKVKGEDVDPAEPAESLEEGESPVDGQRGGEQLQLRPRPRGATAASACPAYSLLRALEGPYLSASSDSNASGARLVASVDGSFGGWPRLRLAAALRRSLDDSRANDSSFPDDSDDPNDSRAHLERIVADLVALQAAAVMASESLARAAAEGKALTRSGRLACEWVLARQLEPLPEPSAEALPPPPLPRAPGSPLLALLAGPAAALLQNLPPRARPLTGSLNSRNYCSSFLFFFFFFNNKPTFHDGSHRFEGLATSTVQPCRQQYKRKPGTGARDRG